MENVLIDFLEKAAIHLHLCLADLKESERGSKTTNVQRFAVVYGLN